MNVKIDTWARRINGTDKMGEIDRFRFCHTRISLIGFFISTLSFRNSTVAPYTIYKTWSDDRHF